MYDIDLLHFAVFVPVVGREVDLPVHHPDGLCNHFARMLVVAVGIVLAIVCKGLAHGDGPHDVEREIELSVAGIEIVVVDGADVDAVVIARFVEQPLEGVRREVEGYVGEIDQYHQASLAAAHGFGLPSPSGPPCRVSSAQCSLSLGGPCLPACPDGVLLHVACRVAGTGEQVATVVGEVEVQMLVAHEGGFHLRAVGEGERAALPFSGDGVERQCADA